MEQRANYVEQLAISRKQMEYSGITTFLPTTLPVTTIADYDALFLMLEGETVHNNMVFFNWELFHLL